MNATPSARRSPLRFFVLLFGLCIPVWGLGAVYDIELFPGFKLFQAGLAMPMVASLLLTARERGWSGVRALLARTYDVARLQPRVWFLPVLALFPSIGFVDYVVVRLQGGPVPPPSFSLVGLLGYCTVFFMTYGEELGLTGYAVDPLQERHGALTTGLLLGLVWAGYHVPGFILSGYYSAAWIFWHALYTVVVRVLFVWIYNNSGKSLFSMALCHWTFGIFWILWPQDNLQRAVPFYEPKITAITAIVYAVVVVILWGPETLARFRFARTSAVR